MAAYIRFIAGYYANEEYRFYKKNKLSCHSKVFGSKPLFLTDFKSVEEGTAESIKKLGGTLGGALVGGLVLGGIGAIVGGMTSGSNTETALICYFKNGGKALAKANTPMLEAIQKTLFEQSLTASESGHYPTKQKMALWKKICIGFVIIAILSGLANQKKEADTAAISTQNTAPVENPCEDIKTIKDWNNASKLWQLINAECKP